jgi:hypothetical protein
MARRVRDCNLARRLEGRRFKSVLLNETAGVERLWGLIGREVCQGELVPRPPDVITAGFLGPAHFPT